MQTFQVSCPHCGSLLTFSAANPAGTQVECLICMRPFEVQTATAVAGPALGKPARENVGTFAGSINPMSKPPVAKRAQPAPAVKRNPDFAALPATEKSTGGRMGLYLAMIALLLLLGGGVVAWMNFPITPEVKSDQAKSNPSSPETSVATTEVATKSSTPPPIDKTAAIMKKPEAILVESPEEVVVPKKKDGLKLVRKVIEMSAPPPPPEPSEVPPPANRPLLTGWGLDSEKIDAAIAKGVAFLKKTQNAKGGWRGEFFELGYASLGGLALLESKVPANDPVIQRAAEMVREGIGSSEKNYEVSSAILFLERLGDPRDHARIQGLAMRLLAAQGIGGGWWYDTKQLNGEEMFQLYIHLAANQKMAPGASSPAKAVKGNSQAVPPGGGYRDPFVLLHQMLTTYAAGGEKAFLPKGSKGIGVAGKEWLKPNLRVLPIVHFQGQAKGQIKLEESNEADNSNTHLVLLALWAARRQGVPVDQAILAAYQRFVSTQNADSGWDYNGSRTSNPSMTSIGLVAMAMGHGVAPHTVSDPKDPKRTLVVPALQDEAIQKGMRYLSTSIGEPVQAPQAYFPPPNLYFLWAFERVPMLYDLKKIDGKDWYSWGAQTLVHTQLKTGDNEGAWPSAFFHGNGDASNTCFALLFLNRSNLVHDLTEHLRLQSGITDPTR